MSRSQPETREPNPAVRWFEWHASTGTVRYYDKETKANVDVPLPFTFLLLDQLACVRGFHEPSQSGIYSNEIRDTLRDPLSVKAHKGGTLVEGLYARIKDRIHTLGGRFVANCYVAVKIDKTLQICSLQVKGAALTSWIAFLNEHRHDQYDKAIVISEPVAGKKGSVKYFAPTFTTKDASAETLRTAEALDQELQGYLARYLARNTRATTEEADFETPDETPVVVDEDSIPF